MKNIALSLVPSSIIFIGLSATVYGAEENHKTTAVCYAQHDIDWTTVKKLIVLHEESKAESEVLKKAKELGIEIIHEETPVESMNRE